MKKKRDWVARASNVLDNKMNRIKLMVCSLIHCMKKQENGHWSNVCNNKLSYLLFGTEAKQHQTAFLTVLLHSLPLQK